MKKNKYLVFVAIGFELVTLVLLSIWLGDFLVSKGFGQAVRAFSVLGAFFLWFISLIIKLKDLKND